jgi:hypothetical protein
MATYFKAAACALIVVLAAGCGGGNGVPQPGDDTGGGGGGGGGGSVDPGPVGPLGDNIFMEIVPPGSNGNSAGGIGGPSPLPVLSYPANYRDQLDLYGDLSYAKPGLKADPCAPPKSISEHEAASDDACNYFKDAGFEPLETVSTTTLTAPNGKSVTIKRDGWGVPYIDGDDRAAAEYGMGYAAAQDRLWLFDLLRYVGRGRASEALGPVSTTFDLDLQFGGAGGYSETELTGLINAAVSKLNASGGSTQLGTMFLNDVDNFVAGMNAWLAFLHSPAGILSLKTPPEYATLGLDLPSPTLTNKPFTREDIVANAVLIQAQFGRGGGGEASNVALLEALDSSIGPNTTILPRTACEMWRDLRHANDPERANTLQNSFTTQSPATVTDDCTSYRLPLGTALWDKGSLHGRPFLATEGDLLALPLAGNAFSGLLGVPPIPFPSSPPIGKNDEVPIPFKNAGLRTLIAASADPTEAMHAALNRIGLPKTSSNWIGVSRDQTKAGHPIIVAGPQTGYFVPQLLWEASVRSHGTTPFEIAAHGISTVNLPYIVIGHGLDFGWSATSAESDLIDTRVSRLCNTDGSPVGGTADNSFDGDHDGFPDADGYLFTPAGAAAPQCVKFYKRLDQWVANPTPASIALGCAGGGGPDCHLVGELVSRYILRTHYGPVTATATVNGEPVVISEQRSTFFGDVDTTAPFALVTTTGLKMNAQLFKQLFNSMTSTFNWIYADSHDLAYMQTGLYPIRHPDAPAELPVWGDGRFEWAADQHLPASFFTTYGGDGNDGALGFPSRAVPVSVGDPLQGYFEWPGYLPLASHINTTNPASGYLANWNNAGAPGWWAADSNGTFGATHRQQMLAQRLQAFKESGRKHDVGTMIEVMGDAAYTDLRGQAVLGLLLDVLRTQTSDPGLPHVQTMTQLNQVIDLMQAWRDSGSMDWINGPLISDPAAPQRKGLGSYRRDRNGDGVYDLRAQVVLMDAWYPHLIDTMLPQLNAITEQGVGVLQGRYDAPRGQGSAYQEGWFEHMKRVLEMVLQVNGHSDYKQLRCADGTLAGCRGAILTALDGALADLGGLANQANWDGSQLSYQKGSGCGVVEACDSVVHTSFALIPVPTMPWLNRPTFQQATQVRQDRNGAP